jgi:hypothetical protein
MLSKLAKISAELAQEIAGLEYAKFAKFNPFEVDGIWYVSIKESEFLTDFEIVEIEIENNE